MAKQLTKQNIGVGVAGTGFIGPAHVEGLRRNAIQVPGLLGSTREKTEPKDGSAIFVIGDSTVGRVFLRNSEALIHLSPRNDSYSGQTISVHQQRNQDIFRRPVQGQRRVKCKIECEKKLS